MMEISLPPTDDGVAYADFATAVADANAIAIAARRMMGIGRLYYVTNNNNNTIIINEITNYFCYSVDGIPFRNI